MTETTETTKPQGTLAALEAAGYVPLRAASRATGHSVRYLRTCIADGRLQAFTTESDRRLVLVRAVEVDALRAVVPLDIEEEVAA